MKVEHGVTWQIAQSAKSTSVTISTWMRPIERKGYHKAGKKMNNLVLIIAVALISSCATSAQYYENRVGDQDVICPIGYSAYKSPGIVQRSPNQLRDMVCMPDGAMPDTAPDQSSTYLLDGKPISVQVYQAALLMNEAIELDNANRHIEAKQKLTEAVRIAPDFPDAHYHLGMLLARLNEHREAVDVFVEALERYPEQTWRDKPEFYLSYGVALAKLGEIDKSVVQMKIAINASNAKTDLPELWLTLAAIYTGSGRLGDAILYYQEFTSRFPNHPEAIIVIDMIKALESEIALVKSLGPAGINENASKDYYAAITRNGATLWPANKMPLKVYIKSGDGVAGFKPQYTEILRTAFDEWSKASQGKVTFKFVDDGDGADILCSWTSDPSKLQTRANDGLTLVDADPTGVIQAATVLILTVPTNQLYGRSDKDMRSISLHEIGHALGLIEHSPNPADIMFFGGGLADIKRDITERDRQTLMRLYALSSASSGPSLPPQPR
jgi:tetratricopeptide (TPR) repeat protein